jgi:hypothetical protein
VSRKPIHVSAGLFIACALLSLIPAFSGLGDITPASNFTALAALIPIAFSSNFSNIDVATAITMSIAWGTLVLAVALVLRFAFARWILVGIGGLVSFYYIYALIDLTGQGAGEYVGLILVAMVLWIMAVTTAVLPGTTRAMNTHKRQAGQQRP